MKTYTISGTEIGAILGLNPYMDPMKLYMRKLGLIDPEPENEAMKWGSAAEHVVARRYARETGFMLFPSVDQGYDYADPLRHTNYNWWTGTPDRKSKLPEDSWAAGGLLEIKIVGERMAPQWGDPPDGDVPEQYLTQVAWYMPLLDVEWADLAVQIGNKDYRVYRINRDREFEDQLRDAALAFINDHLIPQVPPPIDGSASSKQYLNYKYPRDREPMLEPTDEDILSLINEYQRISRFLQVFEEDKNFISNKLKSIIGDAVGMKGDWGRIYWKKNKDSWKVDWKNAFYELQNEYELHLDRTMPNIIRDKHTTKKPSARVFRPYWAKED